jgi:hypothetical protein
VGEYYRIRGLHGQSSGAAHFTISIEVEDAYTSGHPQATREMQVFTIDQDQTAEEWLLEITNPNGGGGFYLSFTNINSEIFSTDDEIWDVDISASDLANGLGSEFYRTSASQIYSTVSVTKTYYDVDDVETASLSDAAKTIFKVSLNKRIDGFSFLAVTASVESADVFVTAYIPADGAVGSVASSAPLGGYFTIKCTIPAGYTNAG